MPKPIHRAEYEVVRGLIRQFRVGAGVKQAELSESLGKPQPYVSAIETGHRRVDLVEIRDICNALGIALPDFIDAFERLLRSPTRKPRPKRTRVG